MSKEDKDRSGSKLAQPPQPPEIEKKLIFNWEQWIGIPLLISLTILALFGLFGESADQASAANEAIAVHAEYPTRSRYTMKGTVQVDVQNISSQEIVSATVRIPTNYVSQFSEVTFHPSAEQLANGYYQVDLQNIGVEETRRVAAEIKADVYGLHEAQIIVTAEGADPVTIPIHTFVFP